MRGLTPADVAKSLLWIRRMQEHVNSCADEFDDPEALGAALDLQQSIDEEWNSLGPLVASRPRPHSVLHERLHAPPVASYG